MNIRGRLEVFAIVRHQKEGPSSVIELTFESLLPACDKTGHYGFAHSRMSSILNVLPYCGTSWGCSRTTSYIFLHPLHPFRSSSSTCWRASWLFAYWAEVALGVGPDVHQPWPTHARQPLQLNSWLWGPPFPSLSFSFLLWRWLGWRNKVLPVVTPIS